MHTLPIPSKRTPWLNFQELDMYFMNPEAPLRNLHAVSALQFTRDLDFIIAFSKHHAGLHGSTDVSVIREDPVPENNKHSPAQMGFLQKRGPFALYQLFNQALNAQSDKERPEHQVTLQSWHFDNFCTHKKFHVGDLYTLRPLRLTYHWTQQEYHFDKQLVSEFCVEQDNEAAKRMVIIDHIKDGKVRREKYINDQYINRSHYDFEIRSHRLNRGLMKTFLFHLIPDQADFKYDRLHRLYHSSMVQRFALPEHIKQPEHPTPPQHGLKACLFGDTSCPDFYDSSIRKERMQI